MGPEWADDPRLRRDDDWVRRELLEAREHGIPVIPVLKGRSAARLSRADLPPELRWLADMQSLRLDTRDNGSDLTRIGDAVAERVPALREADRTASAPSDAGTTRNSVGQVHGPAAQTRDFTGVVGNDFKGSHGPVHTGKGDQRNFTVTGDGMTYVEGDLQGGIGHTFGGPRRREDDR
jgi:hypothetical protein